MTHGIGQSEVEENTKTAFTSRKKQRSKSIINPQLRPPRSNQSARAARKRDDTELRKHPRVPVRRPIVFSDDRILAAGELINLSKEGCGVKTTEPVPKGLYLRLWIFLSGKDSPLEVELAPVRWSKNDGQFGLEFIRMPGESHERLHRALETLQAAIEPT